MIAAAEHASHGRIVRGQHDSIVTIAAPDFEPLRVIPRNSSARGASGAYLVPRRHALTPIAVGIHWFLHCLSESGMIPVRQQK